MVLYFRGHQFDESVDFFRAGCRSKGHFEFGGLDVVRGEADGVIKRGGVSRGSLNKTRLLFTCMGSF